MAFLVAPSMLDQTRGNVKVSTSPRLTEGIGEGGLVLVRAVVAEKDMLAETVPVKPPGTPSLRITFELPTSREFEDLFPKDRDH